LIFDYKARVRVFLALPAIVLMCAATPGNTAIANAQSTQPAPIIQPGAPGEPSREITAEQSIALGQSHYVAADARFMQHMIVHHAQAVEMGDLIEARTGHAGVRLLGTRISLSQQAEIAMMQTWLRRRNEATTMPNHAAPDAHDKTQLPATTPLMPGMLSPAQMAELAAAEETGFDRLFLIGMIEHHQGAIGMVDRLLAQPGTGEDPELSDFLTSINADQSTEILRMRIMLADLG
jgi:uncharacterized protein (DUF305 family)